MTKQILIAVISAIFLIACGGGSSNNNSAGRDSSAASTNTGILTGLVGVRYTTETQSGLIGVKGEFQYLADETLTLFVGNTLLGTLPVASNISINRLFTDLPDSAKGIRTALRMPEYTRTAIRTDINPRLTQGHYNSLHKASNKMQLLLALDNDSDASNGIDITANAAAVNDLSINFDASLYEFSDSNALKAIQQRSNISLAMEVSKPLSEVYKLLNVALSVPRRFSISGNSHRDQTYVYNQIGQMTQLEEQQSSDGLSRYAYSYDDTDGSLLSIEYTVSAVGDASRPPYREANHYNYNDFGMLKTETKETFVSGNTALLESRSVTTNTYVDDKIFIALARNQIDTNGDGISTSSSSVRTVYNEYWKEISVANYSGSTSDDERFKYNYLYDYSAGKKIKKYSYFNSTSYQSRVTDYSEISTAENTERSSKLVSSRPGYEVTKANYIETFNTKGQLISRNKLDLDADNFITKEEHVTYGYNVEGRVERCQFNKGSQNASVTTHTFAYSDSGLVSILAATDYDGDGSVDYEITKSMSYGNDGEILTDVKGRDLQYGEPEVNGIRYLINEYKLDFYGNDEYSRTINTFFYTGADKCYNPSNVAVGIGNE